MSLVSPPVCSLTITTETERMANAMLWWPLEQAMREFIGKIINWETGSYDSSLGFELSPWRDFLPLPVAFPGQDVKENLLRGTHNQNNLIGILMKCYHCFLRNTNST